MARRRLLAGVGGLLAVACCLGGAAVPAVAQDGGVTVFAAASLKNALDEAVAAYKQQAGEDVKVSYAASSALAKQIEQGAPAQVFFSADLDWMNYLDEKDLIASGTRTNLLRNRIVLIAPKDRAVGEVRIGPGFDLASLLGDGRLAVADVSAVPAGKYGRASLEKLRAWDAVKDRLAQAENVRAALALVARGEAPLGIVYQTDVAADPNVKIVGTFPDDSHPPIIYPVALTKDGQAASGLLAFLKGPAAKTAFKRQGFTMAAGAAS